MQFNLKDTVFVLLALAGVCQCQKKCCFDEVQFEAFYGGNVGYYTDGTPGSLSVFYQVASDVTGQQVGLEGQYYYSSGLVLNIKVIQLFNEGKQYTIVNDVCTSRPISSEAGPKKCLPDDAQFFGFQRQGVDELNTMIWQVNTSAQGLIGNTYLSLSAKTCAPLGASFSGSMNNEGKEIYLLSNGGYFNITKGIPDPDKWFSVPSSCTSADSKMRFESEKKGLTETINEAISRLNRAFF